MENAQFRISGLTERDLRRWKRRVGAGRVPKIALIVAMAGCGLCALSSRSPGTGGGRDIKITNQAGRVAGYAGADSVDCDCLHVDAGLLTGSYRRQCIQSEKGLRALAAAGKFQVTVGPAHTLIAGTFCDGITAGPAAWPVYGGPEKPPPKNDAPPCVFVGGLRQWYCPPK
ncbi:MAG: hypothetical protein M3O35_06530 [Acidobacteriota bacterium]|nr:hypothetical protein [Acidobacteriota bacterium]